MTVKAKFIGEDSLGYVHGETYTLFIVGNTIRRTQGGGICPYGSVEKFLENWTDITKSL